MTDHHIEPETETHRTEKAVSILVPGAKLPLPRGRVEICLTEKQAATPGGQHLLTLLVHLLARMKGIVREVVVTGPVERVPILPGVPLVGSALGDGLSALVANLNGPESQFQAALTLGPCSQSAELRVSLGPGDGHLQLGADAWRALAGAVVTEARWEDACPLGPYFAAVMGAAEIFKHLLRVNFGWADGHEVQNTALSLYNFGVDDAAKAGPDIQGLRLEDTGFAGAGAGGTATLYALASFESLSGEIEIVEPGVLKTSNLGRYLMSTYRQVHDAVPKLRSLQEFLGRHAPRLSLRTWEAPWHKVERSWKTVIATVDTAEARWEVQESDPERILEAGTLGGTLYAVLRVVPGGWCLTCKHPRDPDITWKKRALRWGIPLEEVQRRHNERVPVSCADVERLARVQNRPMEDLAALKGVPFDQVPALTECGETPLFLEVPSQAPVLPLAPTAAGVVLAAELVKDLTGAGCPLNNYIAHDLRYRPRRDAHRFKPRHRNCPDCS